MAQSVEHILGKDEVTSSILVTSSKGIAHSQETVDGHFGFFKTNYGKRGRSCNKENKV